MWIFLKDAFLSVVANRDDPNCLLVRGRFPGDIERIFPEADVVETPHADYRFRASVPRAAVAEMLAREALTMTADNFKGSVQQDWRHDLYLDVWSTMRGAQQHRPDARTTRNDQLFR